MGNVSDRLKNTNEFYQSISKKLNGALKTTIPMHQGRYIVKYQSSSICSVCGIE